MGFISYRQKTKLDVLLQKLSYMSRSQRSIVKKGYHLAEDAHKFQQRLSGEPYVIHPLNVALILADFRLDYEAVCAGLLHDVLEDTEIQESYLRSEFGENIANLVKSVTNISVLKNRSKKKRAADNIRKLILASVRDPRVILVKLADKLHNMRTLKYQPEHKAKRIAIEALDIYAPLAGRLGIYKIKWELEDICLSFLYPRIYKLLKQKVSEKKSIRDNRIKALSSILSEKMKGEKIKATIEGRSKHFYSIYQKMKSKGRTFDEIYDLSGFRILVESKSDCYKALGVVHTLWRPLPGRFKDYIAVPKSNGYQSLHTTVIGNDGNFIEIQIRTTEMHFVSKYGIAAHWSYKTSHEELLKHFHLFDHIAALNENNNALEFMQELKESLSDDEVYVFTPKGEIMTLPSGSTILDLAFRIHTELGLHCAGAKIGSRLVSFRTQLKNGDQIEIITNKEITPSERWIEFLKTSQARSKLRSWLRKENKKKIIHKQSSEKTGNIVRLPGNLAILCEAAGDKNISEYQIADCCRPLPGVDIAGYRTRQAKVLIHSRTCSHFLALMKNNGGEEQLISLKWASSLGPFMATLEISGEDRPLLLLDMIRIITLSGAHILESSVVIKNIQIEAFYKLEVDSIDILNNIGDTLEKLSGVFSIERSCEPGFFESFSL